MSPGVNFSQLNNAHLRINARRIEVSMTEHLLYETNVHAVLQHMRSATVTQKGWPDHKCAYGCGYTISSDLKARRVMGIG